jgi:type III secretion system FlhB-like substrate exporter
MNSGETPGKAVALSYPSGARAPMVVAKGGGELRDTLLRLAGKYGIPVENDPILAEALYRFPEGDPIPPELYVAVAEVYAFLIRTRRLLLKEENIADR